MQWAQNTKARLRKLMLMAQRTYSFCREISPVLFQMLRASFFTSTVTGEWLFFKKRDKIPCSVCGRLTRNLYFKEPICSITCQDRKYFVRVPPTCWKPRPPKMRRMIAESKRFSACAVVVCALVGVPIGTIYLILNTS